MSVTEIRPNMQHWQERVDLAAAFRWTARLNMHEAVANHFSLAVDDQGTRFLMNPNQMHFARIRASDMIEVDLDDPTAQDGPDAPDPTAWGLHGGSLPPSWPAWPTAGCRRSTRTAPPSLAAT